MRLAVLGANVHAYRAALDARASGIEVAVVLDLREKPGPQSVLLAELLRAQGTRTVSGAAVYAAHANRKGEIDGIELTRWRNAPSLPGYVRAHAAGVRPPRGASRRSCASRPTS